MEEGAEEGVEEGAEDVPEVFRRCSGSGLERKIFALFVIFSKGA